MKYESGPLPTFSDLKEFMKEKVGTSKESWSLMKEMPAEAILKAKLSKPSVMNRSSLDVKRIERRKLDKSVFITQKSNIVGGGTSSVLNALAAYLRYLEGTARDDWQEYVVKFYHLIRSTCALRYFWGYLVFLSCWEVLKHVKWICLNMCILAIIYTWDKKNVI